MNFEEIKRGNDTRPDAERGRRPRDRTGRDQTERARLVLKCNEVGCESKMRTEVWCQGFCKKHARANGFVPPEEEKKEEKKQEGLENKLPQKNVECEANDDFITTVTSEMIPEKKKPLGSMSTLLQLAAQKNKLPPAASHSSKEEAKSPARKTVQKNVQNEGLSPEKLQRQQQRKQQPPWFDEVTTVNMKSQKNVQKKNVQNAGESKDKLQENKLKKQEMPWFDEVTTMGPDDPYELPPWYDKIMMPWPTITDADVGAGGRGPGVQPRERTEFEEYVAYCRCLALGKILQKKKVGKQDAAAEQRATAYMEAHVKTYHAAPSRTSRGYHMYTGEEYDDDDDRRSAIDIDAEAKEQVEKLKKEEIEKLQEKQLMKAGEGPAICSQEVLRRSALLCPPRRSGSAF